MYNALRFARPLIALLLCMLLAGCHAIVATAPAPGSAPAGHTTPNDVTQARLRVSNCVFHGPEVDVMVNGEVAVNGGIPQANLGGAEVSGYLYLDPGTYSVALVPTGGDVTQALLGPMDVTVDAGHRYTLAMLGQKGEDHTTPLLVDETAAYQAIGASPTGTAHISINNIKGLDALNMVLDGTPVGPDVAFGEYQAANMPVGHTHSMYVTAGAAHDQVIDGGPGDNYTIKGFDFIDCFAGTYPGKIPTTADTHSSIGTSTLSTIDFLRNVSSKDVDGGAPKLSFDAFLTAIQTAGMTDVFTANTPYLLLVPTDDAFAALPEATRAAMQTEPKAAADMLRTHIVPGYYPSGSLAARPGGGIDRTVTNMLGTKLVLAGRDGLVVNRTYVGNLDSTMVANGVRVQFITKVLLPGDN